jgi:hypothetical protein
MEKVSSGWYHSVHVQETLIRLGRDRSLFGRIHIRNLVCRVGNRNSKRDDETGPLKAN